MHVSVKLGNWDLSQLFVLEREFERIRLRSGEEIVAVVPNAELWVPWYSEVGILMFCGSFINVQRFGGTPNGLVIPTEMTLSAPNFPVRRIPYFTLKMRMLLLETVELHVDEVIAQEELVAYPENLGLYG